MKEETKEQEQKKAIEEMNAKPCSWPNCKDNKGIMLSLQALRAENNQLVPIKDVSIPMKFCKYHQLIAMSGMCGAINDSKDPTKWNLYAPTEVVTIAETVLAAMILSGQYDKLIETKKKTEEMLKNKEVQPDENKGKNDKKEGNKSKNTSRNK